MGEPMNPGDRVTWHGAGPFVVVEVGDLNARLVFPSGIDRWVSRENIAPYVEPDEYVEMERAGRWCPRCEHVHFMEEPRYHPEFTVPLYIRKPAHVHKFVCECGEAG